MVDNSQKAADASATQHNQSEKTVQDILNSWKATSGYDGLDTSDRTIEEQQNSGMQQLQFASGVRK